MLDSLPTQPTSSSPSERAGEDVAVCATCHGTRMVCASCWGAGCGCPTDAFERPDTQPCPDCTDNLARYDAAPDAAKRLGGAT